MNFIHDDPDFPQLLRSVSDETRIDPSLVEKDYWVTHCMWALHQTGLDLWFKGGTSLSKGYGVIQLFSEDLDLMIQHGTVTGLPAVANWTSVNKGPIPARRVFYEALPSAFVIPARRSTAGPTTAASSSTSRRWRSLIARRNARSWGAPPGAGGGPDPRHSLRTSPSRRGFRAGRAVRAARVQGFVLPEVDAEQGSEHRRGLRTYLHDTGNHALQLGFPLLHLPPQRIHPAKVVENVVGHIY